MTRVFSSGGGVQSTAALVLSAQGKIDFPTHLFCNVGDDSENPETIRYVRDVLVPYAAAHGIAFHEIARATNGGETLLARTKRQTNTIKIPVRMANGAPGGRSCTQDYKRAVVRRWLGKGEHIVGLGISWDEAARRMRLDSGYAGITNEYPLVNLRLNRQDCLNIVTRVGLPEPPKSSCWFCPFHTRANWVEMRQRQPELFEKAVELENLINTKRAALGKDVIYLSSAAKPLAQAVGDQMMFDGLDNCESGYCMV